MITHQHVKSVEQQDRLVQQRLFALADRLQIDGARVEFERRWDSVPPYQVSTHIVTPGPDVERRGVEGDAGVGTQGYSPAGAVAKTGEEQPAGAGQPPAPKAEVNPLTSH